MLLFKLTASCIIQGTFEGDEILLNTMILIISRYSETGKIPVDLFKTFNKTIIALLSRSWSSDSNLSDLSNPSNRRTVTSPDIVLEVMASNKKLVLNPSNRDRLFFEALTFSLYQIYSDSSSAGNTAAARLSIMKIWEFLILSQHQVLRKLLTAELYRDGFCKYLVHGQYQAFTQWIECHRNEMECVFSPQHVERFSEYLDAVHSELKVSTSSMAPINNKRRSSTISQCRNIEILAKHRERDYESKRCLDAERHSMALQEVKEAASFWKYRTATWKLVVTSTETVRRKKMWRRDPRRGTIGFTRCPMRMELFPFTDLEALSRRPRPRRFEDGSKRTVRPRFDELLEIDRGRRVIDDRTVNESESVSVSASVSATKAVHGRLQSEWQWLRERVITGSEAIEFECGCLRFLGMAEIPGFIVATPLFLRFVFLEDGGAQKWSSLRMRWSDIIEVHLRRYIHSEMAMELIGRRGIELMVMMDRESRTKLHRLIEGKNENVAIFGVDDADRNAISNLQRRWSDGEISNFDYLLSLNQFAGRSFLDVTQYPVFPWILTDFTSDSLSLSDETIFRDLSVPMGALSGTLSTAADLMLSAQCNLDGPAAGSWYHHGTHYSNPSGTFDYLLRIEPFNSLHRQLQNGRYDHSDRLFHRIQEMVEHQIKRSFPSVRELCPELFYSAEILQNGANYEFGRREQDGQKVDDVVLPKWCHRHSALFIELHRRALESEMASNRLHFWIDLIFGAKQTGKLAVESENVFHSMTYSEQFDAESLMDSDRIYFQSAIEQIRSFGNCPKQIFRELHSQKTRNRKRRRHNEVLLTPKLLTIGSTRNVSDCIDVIGGIHYDITTMTTTESEQYRVLPPNSHIVDGLLLDFNRFDSSVAVHDRKQSGYPFHFQLQFDAENVITSSTVSKDGRTVIGGDSSGMIRIWRVRDSLTFKIELIGSTPTRLGQIKSIQISFSFNVIICCDDETVLVLHVSDFEILQIFKLKSTAISLNGDRFAVSEGFNVSIYSIYGEDIAVTECEEEITSILFPDQIGIDLADSEWRGTRCHSSGRIFSGHKTGAITIWTLCYDHSVGVGSFRIIPLRTVK